MDTYENKLVNEVVYESPATARFSRKDWLDLAKAALDQAGLSEREQNQIAALLPDGE